MSDSDLVDVGGGRAHRLVRIGKGVTVGKWARIGRWVKIGEWVRIGEGARISEGATIGEGASIGEWASIGEGARIGRTASIGRKSVIGDDVVIGRGVAIGDNVQVLATPLRIQGTRHRVAVTSPSTVQIGVVALPLDECLPGCEAVSRYYKYSGDEIAEYREHIRFAVQWLQQNSERVFGPTSGDNT